MTVLSQKEIFTINHKGGSLPELIVNQNRYVPNRDELLGNFKDNIVYAELRMIERLFENAQYKAVEKCLLALQKM